MVSDPELGMEDIYHPSSTAGDRAVTKITPIPFPMAYILWKIQNAIKKMRYKTDIYLTCLDVLQND